MAKDANDLIKKFRRETRRPSWPRVIPPEEMPPWPIGRVITPDMFEAAHWLEQHQDQRHTNEYSERLRWLAERMGEPPADTSPQSGLGSEPLPELKSEPPPSSPATSPPTECTAEPAPKAEPASAPASEPMPTVKSESMGEPEPPVEPMPAVESEPMGEPEPPVEPMPELTAEPEPPAEPKRRWPLRKQMLAAIIERLYGRKARGTSALPPF
jgi:hypothetical protein